MHATMPNGWTCTYHLYKFQGFLITKKKEINGEYLKKNVIWSFLSLEFMIQHLIIARKPHMFYMQP